MTGAPVHRRQTRRQLPCQTSRTAVERTAGDVPGMRRHRPKPLSGGVFFTATKAATIDTPIETLSTSDTLRVPLCARHHFLNASDRAPDAELELTTCTGRRVKAGDVLARPKTDAPPWDRVFAPVSGVVGNCVTAETTRGPVAAVELLPGEQEAGPDLSTTDPLELSPDELTTRLAALGITIETERSAPGAQLATGKTEQIIVDGLESAPYATSRTRTLIEHSRALVDTARVVGGALGVNEVQFVVDRALGKLVRTLRRHALGTRRRGRGPTREATVTVVPLPNKYPQCHVRMLFRTLTGQRLAPDRTPRQAGAWIIGTCGLLEIHRALVRGLPPVTQTLTVAGDAVQRPGNYRVPPGMSVAAILGRVGLHRPATRVVVGDGLTGVALRSGSTIVVPGVEGVYAWSASAIPDRTPTGCLRCGFCIDVCPVEIDPIGVFTAVELGDPARVSRIARMCLDCGLCDYVCPTRLPLMRAAQVCRADHAGEADA